MRVVSCTKQKQIIIARHSILGIPGIPHKYTSLLVYKTQRIVIFLQNEKTQTLISERGPLLPVYVVINQGKVVM